MYATHSIQIYTEHLLVIVEKLTTWLFHNWIPFFVDRFYSPSLALSFYPSIYRIFGLLHRINQFTCISLFIFFLCWFQFNIFSNLLCVCGAHFCLAQICFDTVLCCFLTVSLLSPSVLFHKTWTYQDYLNRAISYNIPDWRVLIFDNIYLLIFITTHLPNDFINQSIQTTPTAKVSHSCFLGACIKFQWNDSSVRIMIDGGSESISQ